MTVMTVIKENEKNTNSPCPNYECQEMNWNDISELWKNEYVIEKSYMLADFELKFLTCVCVDNGGITDFYNLAWVSFTGVDES